MAVRQRLLPFRILTCLLYGQYGWLTHSAETGLYTIAVGPASRFFRINIVRLKDQLMWLHLAGFLPELSYEPGRAHFTILEPSYPTRNSTSAQSTSNA